MKESVRFSNDALEAARAVEEAEGEAMRLAWWRRDVVPRIRAAREALRVREAAQLAGQVAAAAVDTERWCRPTRLEALPAALPGFAALWRQVVPGEAVERSGDVVWVVCRCGVRHQLEVAALVFCDCELRWFLRTARDVRVKVWPAESLEQAA